MDYIIFGDYLIIIIIIIFNFMHGTIISDFFYLFFDIGNGEYQNHTSDKDNAVDGAAVLKEIITSWIDQKLIILHFI